MIKALFKSPPSTAEVLARLEADQERRREILARQFEITPNTQVNSVSEYQAALVSDPEQAERLLAEYQALNRELDSIDNQRMLALHAELDAAKAREAKKELPGLIRQLDSQLAAFDKAQAALDQARADLDAHVDKITAHRRALGGLPDQAPPVPDPQAERILDIQGLHEITDRPGRYSVSRDQVHQRLTGKRSKGASRPEKSGKGFRDERDKYQEW